MTMVAPVTVELLGADKGYDADTGIVSVGDLAIRQVLPAEHVMQEIERAGFDVICSDLDETDQPTFHALAKRR